MYRKRNYNKNPGILDMLFEIFVALVFLLGKLIFKLIQKVFQLGFKIKRGSYKVNIVTPTQTPALEPKPVIEAGSNKYNLKSSLLTQNERNFLEVLKQVVGDSYIIENQVQLSRIVSTVDNNSYGDFNRIRAKSVDFVLYEKDYKPYLCIELDDMSHLRWDRVKRDEFVNKVMQDVGLRIIHIQASYSYDLEELRKQIFV